VRKVAAELAPQALHKSQTVELDAADACTVQGDATLLSVLVRTWSTTPSATARGTRRSGWRSCSVAARCC
jgi:hypothetical protein